MSFDVLLPSQHFAEVRGHAPERRLMIAVLSEALNCIEKHRFAANDRDRRVFREAARWFLSKDTAWPYSFECICGVLELDPQAVRQRLGVA
jgi:hypothetical protein